VDGEIRAKRDYFPHFNYGKAKRSAEFLANNLQPMFSFVSFLCAKEKKGKSQRKERIEPMKRKGKERFPIKKSRLPKKS